MCSKQKQVAARFSIAIAIPFLAATLAFTQNTPANQEADTLAKSATSLAVKDSAALADSLRRRQIKKATMRSVMVPGWGQITNNQWWKTPFVYAAVGIPTYLFFDNIKQYKQLRDAYRILQDGDPTNDDDIPDNLKPLSPNSIRFYRNAYRQNVDYSVLAFIIAWGLNVADAAVFANLRDFDVTDDLSLRIKPLFNQSHNYTQLGIAIQPIQKKRIPKDNQVSR